MSGRRASDPIEDKVEAVAESTEFELFGFTVPVKGAVLGFAVTLIGGSAGAIWTASELYSRLVAVEEAVEEIPDLGPLKKDLADTRLELEQEMSAMRLDLEQGMAEIEERLAVVSKTVSNLDMGRLDLRIERVETRIEDQNLSELQGNLAQLKTSLEGIIKNQDELRGFAANTEQYKAAVEQVRKDMGRFQQDMDDVWTALDELTY